MTHHYLNPRSGAHPFTLTDAPRPHLFLISVDMIPRESTDPESPLRAHLRTPNMDRLFADGIRFSHACTTSPLCGPSRAAYLTGRYPYLTVNEERAHDGWQATLRPDDAIFPEYLKAAGYLTKHAGKGHIGTEKFLDAFGENDAPWNRWAPPLGDDDAYLAYLKSLGLEPPEWHEPLVGLRPDGVTPGNSFGGWVRQGRGTSPRPTEQPFPFEGLYDTYLAELAARKLGAALRQRAPDQPLYLQLDFFGPHQPFMVPESYRARFAELLQIVALPDSYEKALSGVAPWPRVYEFYRRNWGLYDADLARRYMAMNLLQVEVLDASLGRFLSALDAHGLYDESAIIFTGDHGEMNTERALVDKGVYGHPKVPLAPLAVKLPRGDRAGEEVADLVSLLDLAPTVLGLAGVEPTERLDGESLLGPRASSPRKPFIFEAGWHVCPNPAVALFADLAGRRFMYTYNLCDPRDELYDMDDRQYRDLSDDPALADVKLEMIRRLGAFLEADPRWTCYWHTFRLDKFEQLGRPGGDFQMYKPH